MSDQELNLGQYKGQPCPEEEPGKPGITVNICEKDDKGDKYVLKDAIKVTGDAADLLRQIATSPTKAV
jgi:hypothetical protein